MAPEREAEIHAIWDSWKHRLPNTVGVEMPVTLYLPPPLITMPLPSGTSSSCRSIPTATFTFVRDMAWREPDRLLHRRLRVMCEGVTVEERIEHHQSALKRGQYEPWKDE
jgi:hypothetical protein